MVSANPILRSSLVVPPVTPLALMAWSWELKKGAPSSVWMEPMPGFQPPLAVLAGCSCAVGNLYNHMCQSCVPLGSHALPRLLDSLSKSWLQLEKLNQRDDLSIQGSPTNLLIFCLILHHYLYTMFLSSCTFEVQIQFWNTNETVKQHL